MTKDIAHDANVSYSRRHFRSEKKEITDKVLMKRKKPHFIGEYLAKRLFNHSKWNKLIGDKRS